MTTGGRKFYQVSLADDERTQLQELVDRGQGSKERRQRADILLLADTDRANVGRVDTDIADTLPVSVTTVERVRKRCVMAGLAAALDRKPHPKPRQRWHDGDGEAARTMLACSPPPAGQATWTLALLSDQLVALKVVDTISRETVRRTLKNGIKPWLKRIWCLPPKANADFVDAMEDVLAVYQREFAADMVLVGVDATSRQQTQETRILLAVRSGPAAIYDFEYERNGTANLFMVGAPLAGWRHVKVTDRRTRQDFAELLQDLLDDTFPNQKLVLVMEPLAKFIRRTIFS
ncbi:MAG: IS630 family transposase [Aestuariivita sp.]|nr:IS630 family transposase [Aestuariivita sp.]MCY4202736.1 IS630 family transposase [Aestuariivita sp.]